MGSTSKNSLDNLKKRKPFKQGEDARRNTIGLNKGSKWKKTLLSDLMTVDLGESEIKQFKAIKEKFPSFFTGTHEQNFQLFLEVKQVSLVFHKDPKVSQTAIEKIKDRIEGKPVQKIAETDSKGNDLKKEPETVEEIEEAISDLNKELNELKEEGANREEKKTNRKTNRKKGS